ncbi:MAG: hypothetical protein IKY94_11760 [Lachnospiraceae bacterium]|nr:hypothetical protein [Lachnospiraceae bacterium]
MRTFQDLNKIYQECIRDAKDEIRRILLNGNGCYEFRNGGINICCYDGFLGEYYSEVITSIMCVEGHLELVTYSGVRLEDFDVMKSEWLYILEELEDE